eukprot:6538098-Prymnesium_polylepis.3
MHRSIPPCSTIFSESVATQHLPTQTCQEAGTMVIWKPTSVPSPPSGPMNICFNCTFMMYPKPGRSNRFKVPITPQLQGKQDCRGYRVARHFIEAYTTRHGIEEESEIFLCEPCDGDRLEVFACSTCRHEAFQRLTYDLFDGIAPDNSFTSAGLGEPEPRECACLNAHERLALSVLKMCDATFLAYAGYGYLH